MERLSQLPLICLPQHLWKQEDECVFLEPATVGGNIERFCGQALWVCSCQHDVRLLIDCRLTCITSADITEGQQRILLKLYTEQIIVRIE